ncbi:MAG TPA: ATP-dependent sacrificial sulfur transferase LarE [Alphaproteobacteria bacterium]|nr:ATP-dependent sacrificial sulfur transferase LarE [Alphaproteobacteria bacterium]
MRMDLELKRRKLVDNISGLGRTLVAYSGGVDSAYLAFVTHSVLGNDMLAVIADSPSLARNHLQDALAFAWEQHIPVQVVQTAEMERPEYVRNDSQRCFHCKDELFQLMERLAQEQGFRSLAYGVNVDDQGDFRPGQRAANQHRVAAPLLDAGLTKAEIRDLARQAGLRVWEKPASACLSSRIEYGRPVTPEALAAVERGEDALRQLGFKQVRVRHHGSIARLEIAREELPQALTLSMFAEFSRIFKELGFTYVTVDTEGFRSGSMNALLDSHPLVRLESGPKS